MTTCASAGAARDLLEQREAVDAGHADVEEDRGRTARPRPAPERRGAVLDRGDLVARAAEALLEDPAQAVLVVGDQDAAVRPAGPRRRDRPPLVARAIGQEAETVVPRPGSLVDLDRAAVLLDDAVAEGEAEAEPRVLGGEERGEEPGERASGMPCPSSITWISAMLRWPVPEVHLGEERVHAEPGDQGEAARRAGMASTALRTDCGRPAGCGPRRPGSAAGSGRSAARSATPRSRRHLLGQERHALEELVQVQRDQTQR